MDATNKNESNVTNYQAPSVGVVTKDIDGSIYENTGWTNLTRDGAAIPLSAADLAFRQQVSLDTNFNALTHLPNVGAANPRLTGPIYDLMNFYVDLQLGIRHKELQQAGDETHVPDGKPHSYANPAYGIVLGEVCIDFDLQLASLDVAAGTATLIVKHIPPPAACVSLPATWMKTPVVDGFQNNHVQVDRNSDGTFTVAIGKEDIDVELNVQLGTGKILSATMNNPVEISERVCSDAAYVNCGEVKRYQILRQVGITQN